MAALLKSLGHFHPKVIAIDKFYSAGSCQDQKSNEKFINAISNASTQGGIQLVVGQATQERSDVVGKDTDCLVQTPAFDFNRVAKLREPHLVQGGVTRLNENTLKIPLRWWVFASDTALGKLQGDGESAGQQTDSFSLQAAQRMEPRLLDPSSPDSSELWAMAKNYEHPFARFSGRPIPSFGAMDILCGNQAEAKRIYRSLDCLQASRSGADFTSFRGKTLVIGEHVESDKRSFPGQDRYGVDLQASYIEALLDKSYVQQARNLDLALLILFVAGTCGIEIWARTHKDLTEQQALGWNAFLFLLLTGVSLLLLEVKGYFTPAFFLAFSGILFLLTTQGILLLLHKQIAQVAARPAGSDALS